MNDLIQNIAVISLFLTALAFLIKKFFWKTATSSKGGSKSCGDHGCGCH